MSQTPVSIAMLLVLVGTVAAAPAAGFVSPAPAGDLVVDAGVGDLESDDSVNEHADANQSDNSSIAPGAQLSGVVGVQKAEIEGDLERRGLDIAFGNAETNESKADVLANKLGSLTERLQSLEEQKEALNRSLENGSISKDQYKAGLSELAARTNAVTQVANQTQNASNGLPADVLEEKGINATAIQRLKSDAKNLTGPEVAAIARSVAGPDAGNGLGQGPPARVGNNSAGPPDEVGPPNGSEKPTQIGQNSSDRPNQGGPNRSEMPGQDRPNAPDGNGTEVPDRTESQQPGETGQSDTVTNETVPSNTVTNEPGQSDTVTNETVPSNTVTNEPGQSDTVTNETVPSNTGTDEPRPSTGTDDVTQTEVPDVEKSGDVGGNQTAAPDGDAETDTERANDLTRSDRLRGSTTDLSIRRA